MINRSLPSDILAITAVLLFLAGGCANPGSQKSATDPLCLNVIHDLADGQAMIVYHMKNTDKTDPQYADWSAYLNDFVTAHATLYKVYAADESINAELALTITLQPKP